MFSCSIGRSPSSFFSSTRDSAATRCAKSLSLADVVTRVAPAAAGLSGIDNCPAFSIAFKTRVTASSTHSTGSSPDFQAATSACVPLRAVPGQGISRSSPLRNAFTPSVTAQNQSETTKKSSRRDLSSARGAPF